MQLSVRAVEWIDRVLDSSAAVYASANDAHAYWLHACMQPKKIAEITGKETLRVLFGRYCSL